MPVLSRPVLPALVLALTLAFPASHAQDVRPNPRNVAAIAAGKEAIAAIEAQLAGLRTRIAQLESAGRQTHAARVYASWMEGQIALGKESFEDASLKASPVIEAKAVEARTALAAAGAYRDAQRTELTAILSGLALDRRATVRPELEAILNHETTQVNVATELAADFEQLAKSLKEGVEPYALFNARKPMNDQAATLYRPALAGIEAATAKLASLAPQASALSPAPGSQPIYNPPASAPVYNPPSEN